MRRFLRSIFETSKKGVEQAFPDDAIIIDVRTAAEYNQDHAAGSKNIPLDELSTKVEMIRKWNKPVITVCRSGSRSEAAKKLLASGGIHVFNGGYWTNFKNK